MKVKTAIYKILILTIFSASLAAAKLAGQTVPGKDENIPFLVTFGKNGETSWGDDDFSSVWFFLIPKDFNRQFYIKVFDPDCGGENDRCLTTAAEQTRPRIRTLTVRSSPGLYT